MSDAYFDAKYMPNEYASCDSCMVMVFAPTKGFPNQCDCIPPKPHAKIAQAYAAVKIKSQAEYQATVKNATTPAKVNAAIEKMFSKVLHDIYVNKSDEWGTKWGTIEELTMTLSNYYHNAPNSRNWKKAREVEIAKGDVDAIIVAIHDVVDGA